MRPNASEPHNLEQNKVCDVLFSNIAFSGLDKRLRGFGHQQLQLEQKSQDRAVRGFALDLTALFFGCFSKVMY